MVLSGIDQLDGFSTERQAHAFGVINVRAADILLKFRRRQFAVAVAIRGAEEILPACHSAAGIVVRAGRRFPPVQTFHFDCGQRQYSPAFGNSAIHVLRDVFLRDEMRGIRKDGSAFDVIVN